MTRTFSPYQLQHRCEGILALLEGISQMGDVETFEATIAENRAIIERCQDSKIRQEFELCTRRCAEMRDTENAHGDGSCLNLENPSVQRLLAADQACYTVEMVKNAKRWSLLQAA
jgi:hypothetical protein